jgi:nicotinate-nucleotide--dimethylbenzimidazole phosphoribosyltransferase
LTRFASVPLQSLLLRIGAPDRRVAEEAKRLLDEKTKPLGSLGRLEEIGVQLASIYGRTDFDPRPRAVVVMAADHGVVRQGVSAYPAAVTAQMVRNFAAGGAAINVLARQMAVRTVIVDMGVAGDNRWPAAVRCHAIGPGTADLSLGPAMSEADAERAVAVGISIVRDLVAEGVRLIATGDMGIGNTTSAAVLTAVFTGRAPEQVTGRGTGVDDAALARKVEVVRRALECNRPEPSRPLEALAKVGGFEIAGLAGVILGSAIEKLPVVLDGFIAGAAALVAGALAPAARPYLVAGHRSAEAGHPAVLAALGLEPILDLGLRLGEGTGAVLSLPTLDAAARILKEMASFASAGVSGRSGGD